MTPGTNSSHFSNGNNLIGSPSANEGGNFYQDPNLGNMEGPADSELQENFRTSSDALPNSVDESVDHGSIPPSQSIREQQTENVALTLTGSVRQRRKWTIQINEDLLRAYFMVTQPEKIW